jgi:hypothetical protein
LRICQGKNRRSTRTRIALLSRALPGFRIQAEGAA